MKNIEKFFKDDKLIVIPKKEQNKIEVFEFFIEKIKHFGNQTFSEKEINDIIKQYYADYAIIRRYLVDYGYLIRDHYGKKYWVNINRD